MTISTLTISPAALAAVAPFMATRDVRFYLNGVCVESRAAGGLSVIATDGHALCAAHDDDGKADGLNPGARVLLPRAFVLAVLKVCKADPVTFNFSRAPMFDEDGAPVIETVTYAGANVTLSDRTIDGRYPDWQAVVPLALSGDEPTINPEFLARVAKSADGVRKHGGAGKWIGVKMVGNGRDRSAVFALQGLFTGLTVGGIIMPLRHDSQPDREGILRMVRGDA